MRLIKAHPAVAGVYLPLAGGTMTGDIQMTANIMRWTNWLLTQEGANWLRLYDVGGITSGVFRAGVVYADVGFSAVFNALGFNAQDADDAYALFRARDNGVALVETARIQGAADPYFQMTLPPRLLPVATVALPAAPLEGMIAYDDTRKRLVFRDNAAWRVMDTAVIVRKAADETINNSAVLQNDNELLLAMVANEVWQIDLHLIFQSTAVADLDLSATMPAGCAAYQSGAYHDQAGTLTLANDALAMIGVMGEAANKLYVFRYTVINGATAGNFQIQWCQDTAEASDTIVRANSLLIARKIA